MPVTCVSHRPVLGEFVLIRPREDAAAHLARFIEEGRTPGGGVLVWDGRAYAIHPSEALVGRILTVVRDGRSWDLTVARGWPGRDRAAALVHRLLARCARALGRRRPPQRAL